MHRSETILHLIHIWSTLSVSHDEDPFICHQPFFAGPPNGHGNVNGVIKEYKLLSVLLSKRKYLCQSTAVVCMLTQPVLCAWCAILPRERTEQNKAAQATTHAFFNKGTLKENQFKCES